MRIALTDFHQGWGGQAQQVLLLALGLAQRGHAVRIFAPPASALAAHAREQGLDLCLDCHFPRGLQPWQTLQDLFALVRNLRLLDADFVHCHGSQDTWLVAVARILGRLRFRLVRTRHNTNAVHPHICNRWLYGRALAGLIAISSAALAGATEAVDIPAERIAIIPPGLPDDFGADVPADAAATVRAEFQIPPRAPLVGLTGRLDPLKGQDVLLRAFEHVRQRHADARLLLVGTGGDYGRLQALCRDLGLDGAVHFTLFREDVARLTAALDVAVNASRREGWGMATMEAMLLGIPVVVTDSGGSAELVEHGALGALVPSENPTALAQGILSTLERLGTPALAEQIDRARARVRDHYRIQHVAARTEALYRSLLEPPC